MDNIQGMIDSGNSHIVLPPGEYKGSFFVNRPCILEGNNTTLWANGETVIYIRSAGVTLINLRVERISKNNDGAYSLSTEYSDTQCENIEIIGPTHGFQDEDMVPEMKKQLSFGTFRSETENTFTFDLFTAIDAEVSTQMKDVMLSVSDLHPGINTITATVSPISANSYIYGDIILKSQFVRRFYINGSSSDNGELCDNKCISKISQEDCTVKPDNEIVEMINTPARQSVKSSVIINNIQDVSERKNNTVVGTYILKRGERIYLEDYSDLPIKIIMGNKGQYKEMDIDPYIFMLDASGSTSCDEDFVYFGNTSSKCGSIVFNSDKSIDLNLKTVPEHIERISFAYSIYLPTLNYNFSKVLDPYISILQSGKEIFRYMANDLFAETTIIFMEIYRHKFQWRINTIGQGYRDGLKRLCSSYGLIVS